MSKQSRSQAIALSLSLSLSLINGTRLDNWRWRGWVFRFIWHTTPHCGLRQPHFLVPGSRDWPGTAQIAAGYHVPRYVVVPGWQRFRDRGAVSMPGMPRTCLSPSQPIRPVVWPQGVLPAATAPPGRADGECGREGRGSSATSTYSFSSTCVVSDDEVRPMYLR